MSRKSKRLLVELTLIALYVIGTAWVLTKIMSV